MRLGFAWPGLICLAACATGRVAAPDSAATLDSATTDATAEDVSAPCPDALPDKTVVAAGQGGAMHARLSAANGGSEGLAWADQATGALHYGQRAGGTWKAEADPVPGALVGSWDGRSIAPAILPGGGAVIAFWDRGSLDFRLAVQAGGADPSWRIEVVDPQQMVGLDTAIAVAADGTVHLAYLDAADGDLRYATGRAGGGGWTVGTVDSQDYVGNDPAIALAADGTVHVAYYRCGDMAASGCSDGQLRHASLAAGAWSVEVVDKADDPGWYSSIAFDRAGVAHASYYVAGSRQLRYASLAPGGWRTEVVDPGPGAGKYSSLAFLDDRTFIAYRDEPGDALMLAMTLGDGSWRRQRVDSGGTYASMVALPPCGLLVGYQDSGETSVVVAALVQGANGP